MGRSRRLSSPWAVGLVLFASACRCSRLAGEEGDVAFTRCAQVDPPEARRWRAAELDLAIEGRVLHVKGPSEGVRVAAFTGPVGAALTRHELSQLSAATPQLVLMLGGLGEHEERAKASLSALASLKVPCVFVAGGADRAGVLEAAFDDLESSARDFVIHASGLRELRIGRNRFAIVAGAPGGRYAVDDTACGFEADDLDDVRETFSHGAPADARAWLLSWAAPAGFGVTRGLGGQEVGSERLAHLAEDLRVNGGLFAFPESAVGQPTRSAQRKGLALVVPRLGRTGATRADGGRLVSSVASLVVGKSGLSLP